MLKVQVEVIVMQIIIYVLRAVANDLVNNFCCFQGLFTVSNNYVVNFNDDVNVIYMLTY